MVDDLLLSRSEQIHFHVDFYFLLLPRNQNWNFLFYFFFRLVYCHNVFILYFGVWKCEQRQGEFLRQTIFQVTRVKFPRKDKKIFRILWVSRTKNFSRVVSSFLLSMSFLRDSNNKKQVEINFNPVDISFWVSYTSFLFIFIARVFAQIPLFLFGTKSSVKFYVFVSNSQFCFKVCTQFYHFEKVASI